MRSHLLVISIAIALSSALAACGNESSQPATGAAAKNQANAGMAHLTVAEQTFDLATESCTRLTLPQDALSLRAGDLSMYLPPEPGEFTAGTEGVQVMLPQPDDGPMYLNSADAHGSWARKGAEATGHVEGTVEALNNAERTAFTVDFSCPYQDIS